MRQSGGARSGFPTRERTVLIFFSLSTHYSGITVYTHSRDLQSTVRYSPPRKPHLIGQTPHLNHHLSLVRRRPNNVRGSGYRGAGLYACKWNSNTWRMGLATAMMKMGEEKKKACCEACLTSIRAVVSIPAHCHRPRCLPRVCMYSTALYSGVHPQPQISGRGASW